MPVKRVHLSELCLCEIPVPKYRHKRGARVAIASNPEPQIDSDIESTVDSDGYFVIIEEMVEHDPISFVTKNVETIIYNTEVSPDTGDNIIHLAEPVSVDSPWKTSGQNSPIPAIRRSKRVNAGVHRNPFNLPRSTCNAVAISTEMVSQVLVNICTALFKFNTLFSITIKRVQCQCQTGVVCM